MTTAMVGFWDKQTSKTCRLNVRFWGQSGHRAHMRHGNQLMQVKKIDTVKADADAQFRSW
jgi:hypothetical protein